MRIVLAGGVRSSLLTLERLIAHGADICLVLGYEPADHSLVSGYAELASTARRSGIPYQGFRSINDQAILECVRKARPDVMFVVGLSQLISTELLSLPSKGSVGFHPTALPEGRGRAPIAWIVLDQARAAATLFELQQDSDSGAIFLQKPFIVLPEDDAGTVETKLLDALQCALDEWLPRLLRGEWRALPQDSTQATWYGKRAPADGHISWSNEASTILRLIKATTRPHPGAFTFRGLDQMTIWRARPDESGRFKGVVGRVLALNEQGHVLVQTGSRPIWITEYAFESGAGQLKVGEKLGYDVEIELNRVLKELNRLKGGGTI